MFILPFYWGAFCERIVAAGSRCMKLARTKAGGAVELAEAAPE